MGVYILYDNGRCLSGGGQGWVDACCEMVCKKCACLRVRSVHATLASRPIGVIVLY